MHGVSLIILVSLSYESFAQSEISVTATSMEKPTPRAITERLVKIRTSAKSAGTTNHFSVSGKPATPAGTPRKRTAARSANNAKKATPKKNGTKANGQAKRKHGGNTSDEYVHVFLISASINPLAATNLEAADSSLKTTTPTPLVMRRVRPRRLRQGERPLLSSRTRTIWRG